MEDELMKYVSAITPVNRSISKDIIARLDSLTKPKGSLGVLEDFVVRLGCIQGQIFPEIKGKRTYVFAGDHGVVEEGVSAFPQSVTKQMVLNFLHGGAAISVLSKYFNSELYVVDMGVNADFAEHDFLLSRKIGYGTRNLAKEHAMSREEAVQSLIYGFELAKHGQGVLVAGEMGIGNTTSSSAITAYLTDQDVVKVVGKGAGVDESGIQRKISVIRQSLEREITDPIDLLASVGGYEIGGIAGLALGCAYYKIPLIIDGFISTAGAAVAYALCEHVKDVLFASHVSEEAGHRYLLEYIGLQPSLYMHMRLGEGTGGVSLLPHLESAVRLYEEMATFSEAQVDKKVEISISGN